MRCGRTVGTMGLLACSLYLLYSTRTVAYIFVRFRACDSDHACVARGFGESTTGSERGDPGNACYIIWGLDQLRPRIRTVSAFPRHLPPSPAHHLLSLHPQRFSASSFPSRRCWQSRSPSSLFPPADHTLFTAIMHLDHLLYSRQSSSDGCIACPAAPPPCNCAANEQCFQVARCVIRSIMRVASISCLFSGVARLAALSDVLLTPLPRNPEREASVPAQ